ncbi:MAG: RNA polymerase sigma factor [Syntrophothermus sp.]
MLYCPENLDFETLLAAEWPRLVRLCAWFTGRPEAAEDLAQDTLVAAWKNRQQLVSPDKLKPWTSAIARNICLNWSRQHVPEPLEEELPDNMDLELELDRQELASLLDRALSLLPPETGQMLVEHYLEESSHAEIGEMMNLKPGAVAVRLQRGKLTLQRMLQTRLKDESLALGLIRPEDADWEETNIWCMCCGQNRLIGKFQKDQEFALRCPQCTPRPRDILIGMDLTQPYYANMVGDIRKFKPAYSRLLGTLAPLYRQALLSQPTPCPACGTPLQVRMDYRIKSDPEFKQSRQILLYCPDCGWASNKTLSGLVMALPQAQKFWRENPRLIVLPGQEIEVQGAQAFVTRIQSVTSAAELTVISKGDTYELMEAHSNIPL